MEPSWQRTTAGAAQFRSVVNADRIDQLGIQTIDTQAIAAVLPARTMQVAALPEIEPHMGAALGATKKDQIAGTQQAIATGRHRNGLAEALLLVGIPRDPDPAAA